jgi:hypothetical protein
MARARTGAASNGTRLFGSRRNANGGALPIPTYAALVWVPANRTAETITIAIMPAVNACSIDVTPRTSRAKRLNAFMSTSRAFIWDEGA